MSTSPRTDALFDRHVAESSACGRLADLPALALRQVKELLEHAKRLEAELATARAEERERCAKVCEEEARYLQSRYGLGEPRSMSQYGMARTIRALTDEEKT